MVRPHSARCLAHLRCVESDASPKKHHPKLGGGYHIREFRLRRRFFAEPLVSELPDGFRLKCEPIAQVRKRTALRRFRRISKKTPPEFGWCLSHTGISLERIFARSTPGKRACRSPSGKCEPIAQVRKRTALRRFRRISKKTPPQNGWCFFGDP